MPVIDRYLQAVSSWLPERQRADIVSELSEDLRSEIEEREEALGRALDEAELAALVERRGHPMWVAERYLPQRHLIGPAMLPAYFRALKIAGSCLLAIVLTLYLVFSGPARGAVPALSSPGSWVWLLGGWTLAYVGLFTAFLAASIVLGLADAAWPSPSRRRLVLRLGVDAFALLLAGALLSAWPWVQITGPGVPADKAALLAKWLNASALVTLLAIAVAYTVRVVRLERRVGGRDAGSDGSRA